jgi:hypothetical protein
MYLWDCSEIRCHQSFVPSILTKQLSPMGIGEASPTKMHVAKEQFDGRR